MQTVVTYATTLLDTEIHFYVRGNAKQYLICFYGYGNDSVKLWDGTLIHCSREPGKAGSYEVLNGHNRTYTCVFID
jgi:hypothetical protein